MSTVRFLREYRRRPIGSFDSGYPYGVHDTLVLRGIAEWVDKSPEPTAVISDPILSKPEPPEPTHFREGHEPESESARDRKPRRFSPKES